MKAVNEKKIDLALEMLSIAPDFIKFCQEQGISQPIDFHLQVDHKNPNDHNKKVVDYLNEYVKNHPEYVRNNLPELQKIYSLLDEHKALYNQARNKKIAPYWLRSVLAWLAIFFVSWKSKLSKRLIGYRKSVRAR